MWFKSICVLLFGYLSISKKARLLFYNFIMLCKLIFSYSLNKVYLAVLNKPSTHLTNVIYNDIINNGCFAIKLTQWIVSRYDVMYDDDRPSWIDKYKNIYEKCPIHSFDSTETSFFDSFNKNIDSVVEIRDKNPIASGSIGQVYIGYMRDTGKKVAIKVKHPEIDEQIILPKLILKCLNFIFRYIPQLQCYFIPMDMNNIFESIEYQLDFNKEAEYMKSMYNRYEKEKFIVIPELIMSSKNIIVMSYEKGIYFEDLDITEYKKFKIVLTLTLLVRNMYMIDGLIHGDLHQGNWKVRKFIDDKDKEQYQLVLYDFGICHHTEDRIDVVKDFWVSWESLEYKNIVKRCSDFVKYSPHSKEEFKLVISDLESEIQKTFLKPIILNKLIKIVSLWAIKHNIILNNIWLNSILSFSLFETHMNKYGITGTKKKEDFLKTKDNIFKVDYLNYISFCQLNQCFPKLCEFLQASLKKKNIEFKELFHTIEYRLECNGVDKELICNQNECNKTSGSSNNCGKKNKNTNNVSYNIVTRSRSKNNILDI